MCSKDYLVLYENQLESVKAFEEGLDSLSKYSSARGKKIWCFVWFQVRFGSHLILSSYRVPLSERQPVARPRVHFSFDESRNLASGENRLFWDFVDGNSTTLQLGIFGSRGKLSQRPCCHSIRYHVETAKTEFGRQPVHGHFGGNFIKLRFRPMIEFLRSNHINCHLEDGVWEVAIYIGHRVSMKGKAWVRRSFLYLGGT